MSEIQRPAWLDKLRGRPVHTGEVSDAEVEDAKAAMELDPGLAKNGWTPEKLAAYFKERGGADFRPVSRKRKPTRTNGKHHPHRWRR